MGTVTDRSSKELAVGDEVVLAGTVRGLDSVLAQAIVAGADGSIYRVPENLVVQLDDARRDQLMSAAGTNAALGATSVTLTKDGMDLAEGTPGVVMLEECFATEVGVAFETDSAAPGDWTARLWRRRNGAQDYTEEATFTVSTS